MLLPTHRALVGVVSTQQEAGTALAYAPARQMLVCATLGGQIGALFFYPERCFLTRFLVLYDVRQRAVLRTLSAHKGAVRAVHVAPDETHFTSGGIDGDVKVRLTYLHATCR
jgi:hypothetical protein